MKLDSEETNAISEEMKAMIMMRDSDFNAACAEFLNNAKMGKADEEAETKLEVGGGEMPRQGRGDRGIER
jgi:hypothetical protein